MKQKSKKAVVINQHKKKDFSLFFNWFAKAISDFVGHAQVFLTALVIIIIWAILGPFFKFSDTWQLIINTATTIITFLMVFLIQNTQNRDTKILNLKIDELIKSIRGAKNNLLDLSNLTDEELKQLEKFYKTLGKKEANKNNRG